MVKGLGRGIYGLGLGLEGPGLGLGLEGPGLGLGLEILALTTSLKKIKSTSNRCNRRMTGTVVAGVLHSRETAARIRFVVRRRASTSAGASPCVQPSAAGTAAAAAADVIVESRPHQLHLQAADRAREGVPLQPLPDARTTHRDRRRARPQRDAGQDLVPEPPHEAEEAVEGDQVARRRQRRGDGGRGRRQRRRSGVWKPVDCRHDDGRQRHVAGRLLRVGQRRRRRRRTVEREQTRCRRRRQRVVRQSH